MAQQQEDHRGDGREHRHQREERRDHAGPAARLVGAPGHGLGCAALGLRLEAQPHQPFVLGRGGGEDLRQRVDRQVAQRLDPVGVGVGGQPGRTQRVVQDLLVVGAILR